MTYVTLARVLRPRGTRGEVAAEILTDFPERLTQLREVWLANPAPAESEPRRVAVLRCWLHKSRAVFHFEGCDSMGVAERLRGFEVQVPIEQRLLLPPGRYYVTDLIGCEVWEASYPSGQEHPQNGAPARGKSAGRAEKPAQNSGALAPEVQSPALLGTVRDVQFPGETVAGTPLLVVHTRRGELLIPLADEICTRIDVAARRIEVLLPEGLRDLNASR